jgi:hypothetical protein
MQIHGAVANDNGGAIVNRMESTFSPSHVSQVKSDADI